MADLSQTAANVGVAGNSARTRVIQVGESVTAGQPAIISGTKYYQADADDTAAASSAVAVFMTSAATDGYAVIAESGPIDLGATLTVGETYVVSATKGAIAPIGDLGSGDYVTHLGVASAAGVLQLNISATGIQVA